MSAFLFRTIRSRPVHRLQKFCLQEGFPFLRWQLLIPLLAVWVFSTAWLVYRFKTLETDSVLYGLPLAFSKGPLSLAIPFIGDFPGYSSVWGHHWPGAMWVRGLLYAIIPFHRLTDLSLLGTAQVCTGLCVGKLVWSHCRNKLAAICATLIVCADRTVLGTMVDHRFESIAILSTVACYVAGCLTGGNAPKKVWLVIGGIAAFMSAWSHPFSMLMGGLAIFLVALDWLIWRERQLKSVLIPAGAYIVSLSAATGYYLAVPEARELFLNNLALQSSFSTGDRLMFLVFLGRISMTGVGLWLGGLAASFWIACSPMRTPDPFLRFCKWSLPLMIWSVPMLYVATASANIVYLSFGIPFASAGLAVALASLQLNKPLILRCFSNLTLIVPTLAVLALYPYRWLLFIRSERPDFPRELRRIYEQVPPGHRVYFPPVLWDVVREDTMRDPRLWSLSIAASRESRTSYEKKAFSDVKPGDYLIVDRLSFAHRDEWGVLPTYEIHPPDQRVWKHVFDSKRQFAGQGGGFGYDLGVYKFEGESWDPASSPRRLEGR